MMVMQLFRRCRSILHSRCSLFYGVIFVSLSWQISCEAPRRIERESSTRHQGDEHHLAGQDDTALPSDEMLPEQQDEENINVSCDLAPWHLMTPRRVRNLTPQELSSLWSAVLTVHHDDRNEEEMTCRPYTFHLHADELPSGISSPEQVHVASELNGWAGSVAEGGWPLTFDVSNRRWHAEMTLPVGQHLYKYVIDEQHWISDPHNPDGESDGFGGMNSVATQTCETRSESIPALSPDDLSQLTQEWSTRLPMIPRPTHYPFSGHVASQQINTEQMSALLEVSRDFLVHLPAMLYEATPCVQTETTFLSSERSANERLNSLSRECRLAVLEEVGQRLFRRPLSHEQGTRLLDLSDQSGLTVALRTLFLSPQALHRSELGEKVEWSSELATHYGVTANDPVQVYRLTDQEFADLLSFSLWGTPPDHELRRAAEAGELGQVERLRAQVNRLLNHPAALEHWSTFGVEWLGLQRVLTAPKREDLFPDLSPELRSSLIGEAKAKVVSALLGGPANHTSYFNRLFDDSRWLNEELMSFYGIQFQGDETPELTLSEGSFRLTEASQRSGDRERGGVLGLGATLLAYAHSDQSSPILRGLFVRERILCQHFGAPPPDAGGVPEVDPNATTRERFRQHSDDPACQGCHTLIDEVGFGFEGFNAVGQARWEEAGEVVDTRGQVIGLDSFSDPTSMPFDHLDELGTLLASSHRAQQCFMTHMSQFILGTSLVIDGEEMISGHDQLAITCQQEDVRSRFIAGELTLRELLVELMTHPIMRHRIALTREE